jgi:PAS domain S-box-containing protein
MKNQMTASSENCSTDQSPHRSSRSKPTTQLLQTEQSAFLQLSGAFFCSIDFEGNILSISENWCDRIGFKKEAIEKRSFLEHVHVNDRDRCQKEFQKRLTGNPAKDCTIRLLCHDQSILWFNLKSLTDPKSHLLHVLAVDITQEKKAQSPNEKPDPKLALDHLREGVFISSKQENLLNIHYTNSGFESITGYSFNEVNGQPYTLLTGDNTDPKVLDGIAHAIQKEEHFSTDVCLYRKDGSSFWSHMSFTPVWDSKGHVSQFISVFEDITQRKLTIEALRENNQSLNEALEDLKEIKKDVIQRERLHALGQMASGIAHDFNNLLAPILGFSELLIGTPQYLSDSDKALNYLNKIKDSAQNAAAVVSRLREFYRAQNDDEKTSSLDLSQLIEDSLKLTEYHWHNQAEASGVTIHISKDIQPCPPILGNGADLKQALANIILNSVDAMPEGGEISIRSSLNGSWACIEISDSGSGMIEKTQELCMEPFFTTKGTAGTGLGLSVVFGIIQRHKGRIEIDSVPEKGTKITINLPIHHSTEEKNSSSYIASDIDPLRVILVDDEVLLLEVVSEYLMSQGHQVKQFSDPHKALEEIYKSPYDLVITDRAMPGMTGDHLAKSIKEYLPEIPIIMLTGFGDIMKQTGDIPQNVDRLLSKPASFQLLKETIGKVMNEPKTIR